MLIELFAPKLIDGTGPEGYFRVLTDVFFYFKILFLFCLMIDYESCKELEYSVILLIGGDLSPVSVSLISSEELSKFTVPVFFFLFFTLCRLLFLL